jgi:hypothetical protein
MRHKALGICVLLLGLLFGTASSAYADTISLTSVSVINFQITPSSGTIVLLPSKIGSPTSAAAIQSVFGGLFQLRGARSRSESCGYVPYTPGQ